MNDYSAPFKSIQWNESYITIIDQTFLPEREVYVDLRTTGQVWDAIKKLKVRGAPAIGIAGAYGFYLGIKNLPENTFNTFYSECERVADYLNSSRPTAVNLSWALNRILKTIYSKKDSPLQELKDLALSTAKTIHDEDRRLCKAIGEHGVELIPDDAKILTHCNTGGLATAEFGTAFSIILHAHIAGKVKQVWVDETRPLLQGARLTAWELQKAEIPFKLNIDSAAASLMNQGLVDLIVLGADRIARNGDIANKIGTSGLAIIANHFDIPFYVAAPYSTIDINTKSGEEIEIEERDAEEVTSFGSKLMAPKKTEVYNPAFDVTKNELITAIITEKGILKPNYTESIKNALDS